MTKAKIAILADVISQRSGARAPIRFAQGFNKLGYDIHYFAQNINVDQELYQDLIGRGIKVHLVLNKIPLLGRLIMAFQTYQELLSGGYDLIFLQSAQIHNMVYLLVNIPKLRTYYGTQLDLGLDKRKEIWSFIPQSWLKAYLTFREGFGLRSSTKVLSISESLVREAKELYGLSLDNVYLGVDNMTTVSKKVTSKDKTIRVISVSRIVPYKGFHTLIEAFKKVNKDFPNMRLDIIGSSPIQAYLDYLHSLKNTNVHIHVNISDAELSKYYSEADIYATCDTWVPWSLTPLEASFFSLPLLGMDYGAMNEIIVHKKSGLLAKDETELTLHLAELTRNKALRESLGKGALERVGKFTWDKTCEEYSKVIDSMLSA